MTDLLLPFPDHPGMLELPCHLNRFHLFLPFLTCVRVVCLRNGEILSANLTALDLTLVDLSQDLSVWIVASQVYWARYA